MSNLESLNVLVFNNHGILEIDTFTNTVPLLT